MKNAIISAALLASSAYGHIQMSNPYPIRSPLNPDASGQKDYSYTNPLSTSGDDFPCKGYQNDPFSSVVTYSPGSEYDLELQGSATHGGGSCQISLSYDNGESFSVIHSMLGGCPLTSSYKFTIPADAPTGEALLAWSWFNKVGNREMYMNCAQVTIGGSEARKDGLTKMAKADAFSSLPPIFIANVQGPGQCKTIEGEDPNFPRPGPSVEGTLSGKGYECQGSAPFLETANTPNDAGAGSGAGSSSGTSSSSPSTLIHGPITSSSAAATSTSSIGASQVADTFGTPTPLRPELPIGEEDECSPGTIICSEDGGSWWLCDHGMPVHMGLVAPGTHCRHGAMQRAQ